MLATTNANFIGTCQLLNWQTILFFERGNQAPYRKTQFLNATYK